MHFLSSLDRELIPNLLIRTVAKDIIVAVAQATNTDPDIIAQLVPGLMHSHWYKPADNQRLATCAYCRRLSYFEHGSSPNAAKHADR